MAELDQPEGMNELRDSGLFDPAWYLQQNPDVAAAGFDPLEHFCRYGSSEGRWPNPWFDPGWYLREHPDVAAAGVEPLLHYHRHGEQEGRRPMPYFDPAWYRAAYDLPPSEPALPHFLAHRMAGQFAPCAELYALLHIPARHAQGVDMFRRYLAEMVMQGREPSPDIEIIQASGLLDANHYLINASDVHEANVDPVVHYCRYGWREGRQPNIYFDAAWYLATNPDCARRRINPLLHYILEGEPAGRRPVPYFHPEWYRRTYAVPSAQLALAHFLAHRRSQLVSPTPLFDVAWYVSRHAAELGPNRDPFAHYLQAGTIRDIDPSPSFDAGVYRRRTLGRPTRAFRRLLVPQLHNPLVHHLRAAYR